MGGDELERRLREAEDLRAIANLKAEYCHLLDTRRPLAAGALFSEDGVWDGGAMFGLYEGRDNVSGFFEQVQRESLMFSMHVISNPFLELRGADEAFGRWYLTMPCTFRGPEGDTAVWGSAVYEDEFVRQDGRWQARRMTLGSQFWTPHGRGWVEQRFVGIDD